MKNLLKFFPFILLFTLTIISCGDDEEEMDPVSCVTDPAVTVGENIVGTWVIDEEASETVTFNVNGTDISSDDAFEFSTTNNGTEYHNFDWEIRGDTVVLITYDYGADMPVEPFIVSEGFDILSNECDRIDLESSFFGFSTILTR